MADTLSIRPFRSAEWRTYRELRLRALADSPDAFGSTLAAEVGRTDADWAHRVRRGIDPERSLPVIAEFGDTPIGLAWGRIDDFNPDVANVYQMWVAPSHRRLGAGELLLETIIDWARTRRVRRVVLSVTLGDTSAYRLYMRAGFAPIGVPAPLRPGSGLLAQPMQLVLIEDAA
jgi:GNAT superfamily N-acetyltransferase